MIDGVYRAHSYKITSGKFKGLEFAIWDSSSKKANNEAKRWVASEKSLRGAKFKKTGEKNEE